MHRTILIFEKLISPSSVVLGDPSSMKDRSVRYIPRYGIHGGSQLKNIPSMFSNTDKMPSMLQNNRKHTVYVM